MSRTAWRWPGYGHGYLSASCAPPSPASEARGGSFTSTSSRPCRRASRVAHLNNHIIPMLLVFFLLFLKVVLSDLQFSQGVVFFCLAATILLQYACTSFLSHTHSLGICTHTYTVTRASVTLARTHDPMLLS